MRYFLVLTLFALTFAPFALAERKERPARQVVSISFQTPTPSYKVKITGIYKVGEELWAVSQISGGGGIGIQVIGTAGDAVTIEPTKLPVKHKVFGKTWNWGDDTDTIEFVPAKKEDEVRTKFKDAQKVAFERMERKGK